MIARGSPKETCFVSSCHGAASLPVFRIDVCSVSLSHPRSSHPSARILLYTEEQTGGFYCSRATMRNKNKVYA